MQGEYVWLATTDDGDQVHGAARKIQPGALGVTDRTGDFHLLSDHTQCVLGFANDMRPGTVWLGVRKDNIQVYRAAGSGLTVICGSDFRSLAEHMVEGTYATGPTAEEQRIVLHPVLGETKRVSSRNMSSQVVLEVHPATAPAEDEPVPEEPRRVFVGSFGIENDWNARRGR